MKEVKVKPVLFTSKKYADGTYPIMIRITINRKLMYEAIGHSISQEAWNPLESKVFESKPKLTQKLIEAYSTEKIKELKHLFVHALVLPNCKTINTDIENRANSISFILNKMKVNEESMDIRNIKSRISPTNNNKKANSLIGFGDKIKDKLKAGGNVRTYKRYQSILNKLKGYLKNGDISFQELTVDFLSAYESYLKKDLQTNSIHNHLKTIRAIYYQAIREEIISQEKNPFFAFKLKLDNNNVKKEKLTEAEIKAIIGLKLKKDDPLWHVRNYFLFSFNLAGIRIGDLIQMKWNNIENGRLIYKMDKSGKLKSLPLTPAALEILDSYKTGNEKLTEYIFPLLNKKIDQKDKLFLYDQISSKTTMINKGLKTLAKETGITKSITSHVARHSFADLARRKKTDLHTVKTLLGHSKISTTEAYMKSLDYESQDEAMKNILDL